MNQVFKIGSFCFGIICKENIPIPPNFLLFESNIEAEYTYYLSVLDQLPLVEGQVIAKREDIEVYQCQMGEMRLLGRKALDAVYARYQEISASEAQILLMQKEISKLYVDTAFSSLFAFERQMIQRDSLILHCAYVEYHKKAILFSAPSGTGKSTQAKLWERYRGSRTVNGDRALLRIIDGVWSACGWPVCGSSGICEVGDFPINTIVMLRQGKDNHVERLSPIQAFSQLYAQITINQWNCVFVQHVMELIENLIGQIPVYQLTCNMTEDAVSCLESVL